MSRLPMPPRPAAGALAPEAPRLPDQKQRDFLLLNIFVLAQHGYVDRAGVLAEALYLVGDASAEVQLARAVLRFFAGEWAATLACLDELDRLDPIERFGNYTLTDRQRMRRYLKARCLYELDDKIRARDAVDVYLRHGREGEEEGG
jgi:hypothetical protein